MWANLASLRLVGRLVALPTTSLDENGSEKRCREWVTEYLSEVQEEIKEDAQRVSPPLTRQRNRARVNFLL